jgi:hypothetical protein
MFGYDMSGNNTSRVIVMQPRTTPPSDFPVPPQMPDTNIFADNQENSVKYANQNFSQNSLGHVEFDSTLSDIPATIYEELPDVSQTYTDFIAETVINIYPNPTKGKLAVKISVLSDHSVSSLSLLNIHGMMIYQQPLTDYNEIDISTQPNGVYIMQITIDTKSTTWKIVKQ